MEVLRGQVALVSGASRGIGLAAGIALAEAGATVAFNYYDDPHEVPAAIERLTTAGRRAMLVQGDVARLEDVERMVAETVAAFGRLDIAVASAAYSEREPFYQADLAAFHRTVDVTMWGSFNVVRSAARQMIAQAGSAQAGEAQADTSSPAKPPATARGAIVVMGSPHAYTAVPRSMAYNMSKAAVDQMVRTAAIELVEHRIRVNTVTPGWIDTPFNAPFWNFQADPAAAERRLLEQIPMGRQGLGEDVAGAVLFLASPAARYITGTSLVVDGGYTAV